MVLYIAHRVNSSSDVYSQPMGHGFECDIRDGLIVTHDPYGSGESFNDYAPSLTGRPLVILNIKCEGIEKDVINKVPCPYFLLDCSFPMIYKLSNEGNKNIAIRFSEYERMDTIRTLAGKVEWVWVDLFHGIHITPDEFREMKKLG